ncbi:MAG: TlpA family protein disulfide reductase [Bacteroidetes bacterium]|nr:TlpA family protein disulfide reductase [Bacteroidota bacterium]
MRHTLFCFCFLLNLSAYGQNLPSIKGDQLYTWKNAHNDTLYVINFWASWCSPCVAEIPSFLELHQKYAHKKVRVILVDCDFKRDIESKVIPFIAQKHLEGLVVYLDEKDPNTWVDLVSTSWSGALPGTMMVCHSKDIFRFYEKKFEGNELEATVLSLWK